MIVEISAEDHTLLQQLMATGRFASESDALHEALQRAFSQEGAMPEYHNYLNEAIQEGLADLQAGRIVSSEEMLAELRKHQRRPEIAA